MPSSPVAVLRRTTLVGAPLLAALSACKWTEDSPRGEDGLPPEPDDSAHVDEAITALYAAQSVLDDVLAAHPVLTEALTPLTAMHTTNLATLEAPPLTPTDDPTASTSPTPDDAATTPPATPPPATATDGRRAAVLGEHELQQNLVRLAGVVHSGPLARVLAAMAAGVAQHLAVLPAAPKEEA